MSQSAHDGTPDDRRQRLERAVLGLQAAQDIADAIGGGSKLEAILELIAERGRTLVNAYTVLIMLREGNELIVAASAGPTLGAYGRRLPIGASNAGQVLAQRHPLRLTNLSSQLLLPAEYMGVPAARTALLVPMIHRGNGIGVLAAFDRRSGDGIFTADDEQLLRPFAASAANAVAIRRSVEADRLRSAIAAAELERARWARELHDETLQGLGGLRVLLSSALRRGDPRIAEQAMRDAITDVETEIENLRAIISDLRPSLLDDLGLLPALQALLERRRPGAPVIESRLALPAPRDRVLPKDLETTTYRLVQESLSNAIKHARATRIDVVVELTGDEIAIAVSDDGHGFAMRPGGGGFGLAGMRERVFLAGGVLEISSSDGGTDVQIRLPVPRDERSLPSVADQPVP